MNNNLKERLIKYAKDKHIDIREETIEKMIKFANSWVMSIIPVKISNKTLYMDIDEYKLTETFRKEKEKVFHPMIIKPKIML